MRRRLHVTEIVFQTENYLVNWTKYLLEKGGGEKLCFKNELLEAETLKKENYLLYFENVVGQAELIQL